MMKMVQGFREKGIGLEDAFKYFDLDANRELSLAEFKSGLETLKIKHTKRDLYDLFSVFANHGSIKVDEFIARLEEVERGDTPERISQQTEELKQESVQMSVAGGGYSQGAMTPS